MKDRYLGEKSEYVAIDVMKFVAAYMIMSIHFLIFEDINKELNFWFIQVFCRLAVPFFFVAAGYFVGNKLRDRERTVAYLKRIFGMYVLYTIIHLPILIEEYQENGYTLGQSIISFLQAFFIHGSYYHLWYFLALIVAVAILYLMINYLKLSDKTVLLVTGILYCIGVLGNAYRNVWKRVPVVDTIFVAYESVFKSTVNGVFFGLFLVAIGYCVRKYSDRIKYRRYWLYAILLFGVMNIEEYFARSITYHVGQSMLFVTPFVVVAIFLAACFIRLPKQLVPVGSFLRNMSVIIYGFHIFIHMRYGGELSGYVMYGFLYFCMIAKRVTFLAVGIVGLSKIRLFSWLKYLY